MAKVSEIKTDINGIYYKININVNSRGIFSCKIPKQMAEDLRIEMEHTSYILHELETKIKTFITSYKNKVTTYELFILVAYHAKGKYIEDSKGGHMFYYNDEKYKIDVSFGDIDNAIGLDFVVAVKETIDGKDEWFKAQLNEEGEYIVPCKNTFSTKGIRITRNLLKRARIIPYSKKSFDTLLSVQNKFRSLSQLLFEFINKDENEIISILTNNKLLN